MLCPAAFSCVYVPACRHKTVVMGINTRVAWHYFCHVIAQTVNTVLKGRKTYKCFF